MLGPRTDWFTPIGLSILLVQEWQVTAESSRVGVRLAGDHPLERSVSAELPSEGTPLGEIQVLHNGQPVGDSGDQWLSRPRRRDLGSSRPFLSSRLLGRLQGGDLNLFSLHDINERIGAQVFANALIRVWASFGNRCAD
uniref:hypothetical protein n=1 Tax=Mesorhizobium sp. M0050 TaxID=2956861 RepID=UPI003335F380